METFTNLTIAYDGVSWPLGESSPRDGGADMGVNGEMPSALDVTMTSEDGTQHKVHVTIPTPPNTGSRPPRIYLIIKGSDRVIASYRDE